MSSFTHSISIHVLWVPGADPQRDAIVRQLQHETADTGGVCLHEDPERLGLIPNWLTALRCAAADADSDWAVILSDDAQPLRGWQEHLHEALWYAPAPVVGLTHFGGYGQKALAKGTPYGIGKYLIWGGAMAIRHDFLVDLEPWAQRVYDQTHYPHDDCMTAVYAAKRGQQVCMTARAIFGQPVKTSLLGHNTPIRSPNATIENSPGPRYSARPAATKISRAGWDKKMDELGRID